MSEEESAGNPFDGLSDEVVDEFKDELQSVDVEVPLEPISLSFLSTAMMSTAENASPHSQNVLTTFLSDVQVKYLKRFMEDTDVGENDIPKDPMYDIEVDGLQFSVMVACLQDAAATYEDTPFAGFCNSVITDFDESDGIGTVEDVLDRAREM